jgi:hypothetical protein
MKTVKFRLVKRNGAWIIQFRKLFWWKNFGYYQGSFAGSIFMTKVYLSKKEAIANVAEAANVRENSALFIQYPTIKKF